MNVEKFASLFSLYFLLYTRNPGKSGETDEVHACICILVYMCVSLCNLLIQIKVTYFLT